MKHERSDQFEPAAGGLLGWLGLGRSDQPGARSQQLPAARNSLHHSRHEMIQRVGDFLMENDLDVSLGNLTVAHGVVSGLNPGLARRIARRRQSGRKVTPQWLTQASANDAVSGDQSITRLAEQLEEGIENFTRSTQDARNATSSYGDALESHVGQLEAVPDVGPDAGPDAGHDAGAVITELADYARAMLERSRKAEQELRESEQEADALRRNLALARRDADFDFLTGLPNRRAFETALETQVKQARNNGLPLCVAFCDIDHFKAVNDTHGHEAGDRILCVVAKTLERISGENCHLARHGGEEFVLLFRGSGLLEARQLLDRAREDLAGRKLVNRRTEEEFGQVTFSGGLADVFAYPDPREALAAADEALYLAKDGGRNQIRIAEKPAPGPA